jgi:hypothetical protein
MLIRLPYPTLHMSPCCRNFFPCIRLHHVYDEVLGHVSFQNSPFGKYRPFSTRAQRESGSVNILQHCFPSIAWLKIARSLKPSPPKYLDADNHFHALQCSFLFPSSNSHQKLEIGLLIFSQIDLRIWKQLITYVGIAWAIDFIKVSRFLFQLLT